jgi:hypothetical protein
MQVGRQTIILISAIRESEALQDSLEETAMTRLVGLLTLAGLLYADSTPACERPGGSAVNVRRTMPSYPMPRMSVTFAARAPYPLNYPRLYPGGNLYPGNYPLQYPGNAYFNPYQWVDPYAGYGFTQTAPVASSYPAAAAAEPAPVKPPAPLLAPPLSPRPDPVVLPQGTNRLLYVAVSVRDLENARTASLIEQELGKLPGVRGVNVKRSEVGPASIKVWFSEQTPVAAADVIGEMSKLGFTARAME